MFYSLNGIITKIYIDFAVVNVSGVGYKIYLSTGDLLKLEINKEFLIFTHFYINSNYETFIFGFLDENSIELFKLLISVSGIGPKTALNVLSFLTREEIINGVKNSDANIFLKVKGLGKKSSLKIIVELSNKFGNIDDISLPNFSNKDLEIVESLAGVGYDKRKIEEIILSLDPNLSEDQKVKQIINKLKK